MGNTEYAEIPYRASPPHFRSKLNRAFSVRDSYLGSVGMGSTDELYHSWERVEGFHGTVRYATALETTKSIPT